MANAPVADPPAVAETKGADTPAETKAATPQSDARTDDGKPAEQATLQTAPGTETPGETTPPAPEGAKPAETQTQAPPPQRTEAEIERDIEARKAAEAAREERERRERETRDDLRNWRRNSPSMVRDALDDLERELELKLTPDQRKVFTSLIDNANLKAEAAVKLGYEDDLAESGQSVESARNAAFVDTIYDLFPDSLHGKLTAAVNGKPRADWIKEATGLMAELPAVKQAQLADAITSLTNVTPEGEERTGMAEALKGAKSVDEAHKTFWGRAIAFGHRMPPGEPSGNETPAGGGGAPQSASEADEHHAAWINAGRPAVPGPGQMTTAQRRAFGSRI